MCLPHARTHVVHWYSFICFTFTGWVGRPLIQPFRLQAARCKFTLHLNFVPQAHQMYIADIPPHDLSAEFVVLTERRRVEAEMAKRLQVRRPRSACWSRLGLVSPGMHHGLTSRCLPPPLSGRQASPSEGSGGAPAAARGFGAGQHEVGWPAPTLLVTQILNGFVAARGIRAGHHAVGLHDPTYLLETYSLNGLQLVISLLMSGSLGLPRTCLIIPTGSRRA